MNDAVKLESEESVEPQTLEENSALDYEGWLEAILAVARHHRLDCSAQNVRIAAQWSKDVNVDEVLRQMARQAGLTLKIVDFTPSLLVQRRLPLVLQFSDGQIGCCRRSMTTMNWALSTAVTKVCKVVSVGPSC